jgi:hypothetical protein
MVPLATVAGGNPVTDAAGDIPTPPLIVVAPVLEITGVPARTAKLAAVPSPGAVEAIALIGVVISAPISATNPAAATLAGVADRRCPYIVLFLRSREMEPKVAIRAVIMSATRDGAVFGRAMSAPLGYRQTVQDAPKPDAERPRVEVSLSREQLEQYKNIATWDLARLQNNGLKPKPANAGMPGTDQEIADWMLNMAQGSIVELHGAASGTNDQLDRLPEPTVEIRVISFELPASLDEGHPLETWFDAKMAHKYFPELDLQDALNEMARTAVLSSIERTREWRPEHLGPYPGGDYPEAPIVFRGTAANVPALG